jgi:hypothetical protein
MADFLDELDGDFVKHTRVNSGIAAIVGSGVNARVFPMMARQGAAMPYIAYTQAAGNTHKSHAGRTGCKEITLHVYCFAAKQPEARALANLLEPYWLDTEGDVGSGTKIHVCNGGIVDDGVEPAQDSSDKKKFWVRLVLRLLIG